VQVRNLFVRTCGGSHFSCLAGREQSSSRETKLKQLRELEEINQKHKDELAQYADNDPERVELMCTFCFSSFFFEYLSRTVNANVAVTTVARAQMGQEAGNRWTDNIWCTKSWCNKMGWESSAWHQRFEIPEDYDYIEI